MHGDNETEADDTGAGIEGASREVDHDDWTWARVKGEKARFARGGGGGRGTCKREGSGHTCVNSSLSSSVALLSLSSSLEQRSVDHELFRLKQMSGS